MVAVVELSPVQVSTPFDFSIITYNIPIFRLPQSVGYPAFSGCYVSPKHLETVSLMTLACDFIPKKSESELCMADKYHALHDRFLVTGMLTNIVNGLR